MRDKKTIAVLFGGRSDEYAISLQSAYTILNHLDPKKYDLLMVGITQEGNWYHYKGSLDNILINQWFNEKDCDKAILSPNREEGGFLVIDSVTQKCALKKADAIFPVLHGQNGEDGSVQGIVTLSGIPLIGCNILSSAMGIDKELSHIVVSASGVQTPKGICVDKTQLENLQECVAQLKYPLFVKPVSSGSSIGISFVKSEAGLKSAAEKALQYSERVRIEEKIEGFEVGCAVVEGEEGLILGEVDQVILQKEVFDAQEKSTMETSVINTPAKIPKETAEKIKAESVKIFKALHCKGFARIDMFLTPQQEIVFNEVNTMPGFTENSRFPKMLKAKEGMTIAEILDKMVDSAFLQ